MDILDKAIGFQSRINIAIVLKQFFLRLLETPGRGNEGRVKKIYMNKYLSCVLERSLKLLKKNPSLDNFTVCSLALHAV